MTECFPVKSYQLIYKVTCFSRFVVSLIEMSGTKNPDSESCDVCCCFYWHFSFWHKGCVILGIIDKVNHPCLTEVPLSNSPDSYEALACVLLVLVCACLCADIIVTCWALSHHIPTRSSPVQMDEPDALRLKLHAEDSVSLAPSLAEPINLEGQLVTGSRIGSCWKLPVQQHHKSVV